MTAKEALELSTQNINQDRMQKTFKSIEQAAKQGETTTILPFALSAIEIKKLEDDGYATRVTYHDAMHKIGDTVVSWLNAK